MAIVLEWLIAYALGSVVGALLLGRLRGVDIRTMGSGNAGATNALRTQGKGFALCAALFDAGKGVIAALLIAGLLQPATSLQQLLCALAAVVGHCFPMWHGFRGGKGAATLFAAVLCLYPLAALCSLIVWLLVLLSSGYVSLSTIMAAAVIAPSAWLSGVGDGPVLSALGVAGIFVIVMHQANIRRLLAGTENRFARLRWFGKGRAR